MRILIFNWRDIKNPSSGGAEILTHEMAKRWVSLGNSVVLFSSFFPNAAKEEIIDGVKIIRRGNPDIRSFFHSVHFCAFLYYTSLNGKKFDVVIDEIHGIPFFTPWYVKEKKIVLICEVAGELWIKFFGFFFGSIGWLAEKSYLRLMYRNVPYVTISESTKKDLLENGIKEKNITVIPMGINIPNIKKYEKQKKHTLIFIGRLTVAKGVEDAIFSLKEIIKRGIDAELWIVGKGDEEYVNCLKNICKKINIFGKVTFFGFVSEMKKFELLQKAHILIHTSTREGFGLTVAEAGFVGTPVIAYNSPGLRDTILNGRNGLLVKNNTAIAISEEAIRLFKDTKLYLKLSRGAREEAGRYNWDNTAMVMLNCLRKFNK